MLPPTTSEGFHWTAQSGIESGVFRCKGVVEPESRFTDHVAQHDVIVIGAGYAGLIAARDLVLQGT